jgi:cell division control protein 45
MDMDLKKELLSKLESIAPEYGLVELSYPSFMRCYGYRSQPLSAADAVEAVSALLDVAGGVRMEVEVEGARNGGEWFGGGRVWEVAGNGRRDKERDNVPPGDSGTVGKARLNGEGAGEGVSGEGEGKMVLWWIRNFWAAFDALSE